MRRPSLIGASAVLAASATLGCSAVSGRTAAPATAATTAPTLYVSTTGSDGAPCTRSAPCQSFDRAYHVAKPGTNVAVLAGDYPDQTIQVDATKVSSKRIVFAPAPGAAVTVGDVTVYGSHLEFRGMVIGGVWETKEGADDVVFRSIRATGMYVDSSRDIRVLGGSYGPSVDNDAGQIRPSCPGCAAPQGILLDGVVFHDATLTPGSDAHVECLQVGEVDGLTIRNSRFNNCETHNVFISPWWGGPERNILLENNFGGNVRTGYYGFRVAAGDASDLCENITFRYNSAETAFLIQCGQAQNVSMIANVGPYVPWACDTRITYIRNVFQGAKCGATDLNAPSDFVDPAANDLHLKPGAPAIGHGYRKSFPKRDIDGRPRPIHKGRMPDAGAAERS